MKIDVESTSPGESEMFIRDEASGVFQVIPDKEASAPPEPVLAHLSERPILRVLIENISRRSVISLECDGGSVVGEVPTWVLNELDRRRILPPTLGMYLRDMGYM